MGLQGGHVVQALRGPKDVALLKLLLAADASFLPCSNPRQEIDNSPEKGLRRFTEFQGSLGSAWLCQPIASVRNLLRIRYELQPTGFNMIDTRILRIMKTMAATWLFSFRLASVRTVICYWPLPCSVSTRC